jgi:hypothetical protein
LAEAFRVLRPIADRGADALATAGTIDPGLAEALKTEARRRIAAHTFFGHVAYASLTARNIECSRPVG